MISKKNKGYSLVEMIIVLAIVAVLATLSLVSITLINTARAKDASNKFGSEVSETRKKAIEMTPSRTSGDPYWDDTKEYRYGLVLYEDDGKFQTDQVIVEKNASGKYVYRGDGAFGIGHSYPAYDDDGNALRDNVKYSSRVEVKYTGSYVNFLNGNSNTCVDGAAGNVNTERAICIVFDKHGNCVSGYGEYTFYKRNANKVARVIVKQNGSIVVR